MTTDLAARLILIIGPIIIIVGLVAMFSAFRSESGLSGGTGRLISALWAVGFTITFASIPASMIMRGAAPGDIGIFIGIAVFGSAFFIASLVLFPVFGRPDQR